MTRDDLIEEELKARDFCKKTIMAARNRYVEANKQAEIGDVVTGYENGLSIEVTSIIPFIWQGSLDTIRYFGKVLTSYGNPREDGLTHSIMGDAHGFKVTKKNKEVK